MHGKRRTERAAVELQTRTTLEREVGGSAIRSRTAQHAQGSRGPSSLTHYHHHQTQTQTGRLDLETRLTHRSSSTTTRSPISTQKLIQWPGQSCSSLGSSCAKHHAVAPCLKRPSPLALFAVRHCASPTMTAAAAACATDKCQSKVRSQAPLTMPL